MLDPVGRHPPPGRPLPLEGVAAPRIEITTQVLAAIALIGALKLGLLASLLAGLLVYELVHVLAPRRNDLVRRRTGDLMSRVGSDTTLLRSAVTSGVVELVMSPEPLSSPAGASTATSIRHCCPARLRLPSAVAADALAE